MPLAVNPISRCPPVPCPMALAQVIWALPIARRPSVLYYLARAEYGNGMFEPAVRNMERYLDAVAAENAPKTTQSAR